MLKPQLYYDYPQEAWHDLLIEAEDYLYEDRPGVCIVGAWPAGPLVYGIPNEKPGIFVLCTDDINRILDPLYCDRPVLLCEELHSQITIWSINQWVRTILSLQYHPIDSLLPIFLPLQESIYMDDSINEVLTFAIGVIKEYADSGLLYMSGQNKQQQLHQLLEQRASLIFAYTKLFQPCINDNYDTVKHFDLVPELFDSNTGLDDEIISCIVDMEKLSSNDLLAYKDLLNHLTKQYVDDQSRHRVFNSTSKDKLRKSVISLYKKFI